MLELPELQGYGFAVPEGAGKVQWEALQQRRDEYVKKLNKNYTAGWQKEGRGVTVQQSHAWNASHDRCRDCRRPSTQICSIATSCRHSTNPGKAITP